MEGSEMDTLEIRGLVAEHMVPEAPLAQALLSACDRLDELMRGMAAVVERIETLEDEVLARDPQPELGL